MRFRAIYAVLLVLGGCEAGSERQVPANSSRRAEGDRPAAEATNRAKWVIAKDLDARRIPAANAPTPNAAVPMPAAADSKFGAPAMAAKLDVRAIPAADAPPRRAARNVPAVADARFAAPAMAAKLDARAIPAAGAAAAHAAKPVPPAADSSRVPLDETAPSPLDSESKNSAESAQE